MAIRPGNSYADKIDNLRREIDTRGARPVVIDMAVSELVAQGDERLPKDFLSLLSDKAEHDEGMFSLIHAAEEVDDRRYVDALLAVFPGLSSSAPRWASIVLMRALNNERMGKRPIAR